MTTGLAVRTVRQKDQRPRWYYHYKNQDRRYYHKDAADVIEIKLRLQVDRNPYALLVVGVIAQAMRDALNPSWNIPKNQYEDSFRFFRDGRLESLADRVGLEADYVRRLIVEAVGGDINELGAQ